MSVVRFLLPVIIAITLVSAPTASAHTALVSTTPADGETVTTAPTSIVLQFNEEPLEAMVDVVITDSSGDLVSMDAAEASGTDVLIPWPPSLGPGDYAVAYRVVSADGHPITGTFSFNFTGQATSTEAPVVHRSAAEEVLADTQESPSRSPVIIGAVAFLFIALAIVLTRRRAR